MIVTARTLYSRHKGVGYKMSLLDQPVYIASNPGNRLFARQTIAVATASCCALWTDR